MEARRTRRSKSDLVEALTEEAIATPRFAGLAFRGEDWSRRPWVLGCGRDVWEIVDMVRSYEGDVDRLVDDNTLEPRHVRLALAYAEDHPEEIEEAIAQNRRPVGEFRELYRFVDPPPATAAAGARSRACCSTTSSPGGGSPSRFDGTGTTWSRSSRSRASRCSTTAWCWRSRRARSEERIVVTRNSRDFAPILVEWARDGWSHAGCILIWTLDHARQCAIVAGVERLLATHPQPDGRRDTTRAL